MCSRPHGGGDGNGFSVGPSFAYTSTPGDPLVTLAANAAPLWLMAFLGAGSPLHQATTNAPTPVDNDEPKLSLPTRGILRAADRSIPYVATAGTLTVPGEGGKATGRVFFISYVAADDQAPPRRPITFAFNGGPGTASAWLHLGALGPKRVRMSDDGLSATDPYQLVENEDSLLLTSDLVFIDPVSTGFSRATEGEDPKQFHGLRADIASVAQFIRNFLTRFNRWASPKFVLGESYGGIRAVGVAEELQRRHSIELTGVVLVSSQFNQLVKLPVPGHELPYAVFLPTFSAIAWHHRRLPAELQRDFETTIGEARQFAFGPYLQALVQGHRLDARERRRVLESLSRYTGLDAAYLDRSDLRVSESHFRRELLRDSGRTVGRLDGRFTTREPSPLAETAEFDPSYGYLKGAYTALINDYVRRDLGWSPNLVYEMSAAVQPWRYDDFQNRYVNMVDALRLVMARNPTLRVFAAHGYFDLAAPFAGMEYTLNHLGPAETVGDRVAFVRYPGGHMMYIQPRVLHEFGRDLSRFVRQAAGDGGARPTAVHQPRPKEQPRPPGKQ